MRNSKEMRGKLFKTIALGIFFIAILTACESNGSYLYVQQPGITGKALDSTGHALSDAVCFVPPGDHHAKIVGLEHRNIVHYRISDGPAIVIDDICAIEVDNLANTLNTRPTSTVNPDNLYKWVDMNGTPIPGPSSPTPSP